MELGMHLLTNSIFRSAVGQGVIEINHQKNDLVHRRTEYYSDVYTEPDLHRHTYTRADGDEHVGADGYAQFLPNAATRTGGDRHDDRLHP